MNSVNIGDELARYYRKILLDRLNANKDQWEDSRQKILKSKLYADMIYAQTVGDFKDGGINPPTNKNNPAGYLCNLGNRGVNVYCDDESHLDAAATSYGMSAMILPSSMQ
jgi:hypothetical protein